MKATQGRAISKSPAQRFGNRRSLPTRPAVAYQSNSERLRDHACLLALVHGKSANGGAGAGIATGGGNFTFKNLTQSWLHKNTPPHVFRFFLATTHPGRF